MAGDGVSCDHSAGEGGRISGSVRKETTDPAA